MIFFCFDRPTASLTAQVKALTVYAPVFLYEFAGGGICFLVISFWPITGVLFCPVMFLEMPVKFSICIRFLAATLIALELALV